jgi:predicted kinase
MTKAGESRREAPDSEDSGFIILLIGLPAVGKSTLSGRLACALDATVVDRDKMARAIFPGVYFTWSRSQMKTAGEICAEVAETVASEHPDARLIIDGFTFSRKSDIDRFVRVANEVGIRLVRIHCVADEEVVRARIEADEEGLNKRRDWHMYASVRDRFERLEAVDLTLDLTSDVQGACKKIMSFIRETG